MPLRSGRSKAALSQNIATEVRAGKPPKQAEAIAFAKARGDAPFAQSMQAMDAFADDLKSRIAGAMQLYERGATAGESQAALEALRRMGVEPASHTTDPKRKQRYSVTVMNGASVITTYRGIVATSGEDAQQQAIARVEELWGKTAKSGVPKFTATVRADETVRVETVRNETNTSETIGGVETIRAAFAIFVCGDRALFLQRSSTTDHQGEWAYPGGKIEAGESAEDAMRRECVEEMGIMPKGVVALHARRISTGIAPPVQIDGPTPESAALPPPLPPEPTVDATTFIVRVKEEFEPTLNSEHSGYAWAPIVSPPQPMHPAAADALSKISMNEYDIAVEISAGRLTSPQQFMNIWLFDMRITGTGMSFRAKHDEFVMRDPSIYLNDYFLRRCAGLTVIVDHPPGDTLDTDEFRERNVGNICLPYIKGDEVWGVAKIYDAAAAKLMAENQLSTSPAVVFRPDDGNKEYIVDGEKILVEGDPSLLDHLAVCFAGVWDKGGAPTGIVSTRGDSIVAEKTEDEKKADRSVADGVSAMLDSFRADMKKFGDTAAECMSKMDEHKRRMDEDEKERKDKGKKDAKADGEKSEDEKKADAEKEEKEKADKAKKDAEEKEKEDKEKADKAKKDAGDDVDMTDSKRVDSLVAKAVADATKPLSDMIKELRGNMPRQITDDDRAKFADVQARADVAYNAFALRAPAPLLNEQLGDYRRRLASGLKQHSPNWKDVDLVAMQDDASFGVIENQVYTDSMATARNPTDVPFGQLRPFKRDDGTGMRQITEYQGDPRSWMQAFGGRRMMVKQFNIPQNRIN
jgi:8-oxo-dGTP pyrophosphatase MutT (NUDIX family)